MRSHKFRSREVVKRCPAGLYLTPDPKYKPTYNGCGPQGSSFLQEIGKLLLPEQQDCCKEHDICYARCDLFNKDYCDTEFRKCMDKLCVGKTKAANLVCLIRSKGAYEMVNQMGLSAFKASQNEACYCAPIVKQHPK
jgi:hypothetical protein